MNKGNRELKDVATTALIIMSLALAIVSVIFAIFTMVVLGKNKDESINTKIGAVEVYEYKL